MPSVKVVNGKQIVVENLGPIERLTSFIVKPFVRMSQHRDLIAAILRREVRERFKGSIAGWIWAIIAPLLMIAVYSLVFSTALTLPLPENLAKSQAGYALFIFGGLIIFNFFSEMAFRAPMLLHEYTHFIKQTIFPSDMLAVISTLRATGLVHEFVSLWIGAWLPSWLFAFPAVLLVAPLARIAVARLTAKR